MTFVFSESGRRYGERDVAFAQELAGARRRPRSRTRACTRSAPRSRRRCRRASCRRSCPRVPGWRFAADYRPGQRGAEVGGDFYDVFAVEDGHVVVLGDVTGKGVRAAALTSLVRYTARTAGAFDASPSAVLAQVHRALRQRPRLAPVTMVCGLLRGGDADARRRRPPAAAAQARGRRREASARPGSCSARSTTTSRAPDVDGLGRAGRHAAALHRRRHRDAGRGRPVRGRAAAAAVEAAPAGPEGAARRRLGRRSTGSPRAPCLDDRAMLVLQRT